MTAVQTHPPRRLRPYDIYSESISRNLSAISAAVGIDRHLWNPASVGITRADQLIPVLDGALATLRADPDRFFKYDAPQRWGIYEQFVAFLEKYLAECRANPTMDLAGSR